MRWDPNTDIYIYIYTSTTPHTCCLKKKRYHTTDICHLKEKLILAPLERQVTFDPARIVPWGSPAGSGRSTKETAEKHFLIEAKNLLKKKQKLQWFKISYDEKLWHSSIPGSDKTDHNKTWILLVMFQCIK